MSEDMHAFVSPSSHAHTFPVMPAVQYVNDDYSQFEDGQPSHPKNITCCAYAGTTRFPDGWSRRALYRLKRSPVLLCITQPKAQVYPKYLRLMVCPRRSGLVVDFSELRIRP
jgi:hypothetical protein